MYSKKVIFLLAIQITFFLSCDVPRNISVDNKTNQFITYNYSNPNNQITNLRIPPYEKRSIVFGFGTRWNEKELEQYLNGITDFKVVKGKDTINLNTQVEIKEYFISRIIKVNKLKVKMVEK